MKQNTTRAHPATSAINPHSKKTTVSSKSDLNNISTKLITSKTSSKQAPPLTRAQTLTRPDPQESVRMSLVSVDQANKENPQCVAVYCEKIFQRFLEEEVC